MIYQDLFDSWGKATYQVKALDSINSYHLFPIKFDKIGMKLRDKIFVELRKLNIGVQIHYIPVHLHPYHSNIMKNDLPNTMDYYENCMTLPLFPGLEDDVIKTVFDNIRILYNTYIG